MAVVPQEAINQFQALMEEGRWPSISLLILHLDLYFMAHYSLLAFFLFSLESVQLTSH